MATGCEHPLRGSTFAYMGMVSHAIVLAQINDPGHGTEGPLLAAACRPKEISASQPFFRFSISCFTRSISNRLASVVPHRGAGFWVASPAARMRALAAS